MVDLMGNPMRRHGQGFDGKKKEEEKMKFGRLLFVALMFVAILLTIAAWGQYRSTGEWSKWDTPNGTYDGLDARVKCAQGGPDDARYLVQFRNRYHEAVRV